MYEDCAIEENQNDFDYNQDIICLYDTHDNKNYNYLQPYLPPRELGESVPIRGVTRPKASSIIGAC